ncbi:DUF2771 domain-containing protein [Streptomyces sp. R1]|uniref:DUF2771 domain-containing protein n=1 Tax=unclassified Streptomyces TaxID=2593676 RepID=UPI0018F604F4|nr:MULTISPECIES: DUF2771 domain-containing protein [unclassified Streptomyces]MCC8336759.1 DUF2771 domain-containing protein [Streptomyces sp. R1]
MTTLPRGTAALGHRAVRRRRAVAAVGAVSAGLLLLSACDEPTPIATITVGSDSVSSEATCGGEGKTLSADEITKCLKDKDAKSITVDQDETVRFGVDPDIADKHWTILMNGQQLVEDSDKTYRTVPGSVFFNAQYGAQGDSTNVAVAARDGKDDSQNITAVWVFELKKD